MNRRFFIPAVASAFASWRYADAAPSVERQMWCNSPADAFVARIEVASGAVSAGQTLILLNSPTLDQELSVVQGLLDVIHVRQRYFVDGRLADERQKSKNHRNADVGMYLNLQTEFETFKRNSAIGNIPTSDLLAKESQARVAAAQAEQSRKAFEDFDQTQRDSKDLIFMLERRVKDEIKRVSEMRALLRIASPASGVLVLSVEVGSFVEKGSELGYVRI